MMNPLDGDERYPVDAPGWAAIDRALQRLYPALVPHQFASQTAYDLGSRNPLPAVSVYEAENPPHWHFVTFGLTELFDKTSPNPQVSGFGHELTLRLRREGDEDRPPAWALQLLQAVGGNILEHRQGLDSGHLIDLGGPLRPAVPLRPCDLTGFVCIPDPDLGKIDSPNGSVLFLQLVGMTAIELQHMRTWDLARKVNFVSTVADRGITLPDRLPFADDPKRSAAWRRFALNVLVDP
jgi:hypothetical protein